MFASFINRVSGNEEQRDSLFGLPLAPSKPLLNSRTNKSMRQMTKFITVAVDALKPDNAYHKLAKVTEDEWLKRGETRALTLFHEAAEHVPAYKKFLAKNKIKPDSIKTIKDFKKVPITDKENYLRAYPLRDLCWHGDISSTQIISVSSGSSGKPFFWPRSQILDAETALEHEMFLQSFFELDQYSTLFVVCFAMGMYVAGPITLNSVLRMSEKGYPVTVVTPGYSPNDVLTVISELAGNYDQVVLAGYPPYIKEIIDQGIDRGINWKDIKLRFLLAGEGFNESWRTYVAELSGGKSPTHDFLNLYGTADAAVVAHETPASIVVRRRLAQDVEARKKIFRDERLPSFLQYYPEHKYFEQLGEELIFTATAGIPLIRYNIHDRGGVLVRSDLVKVIPSLGEYFNELNQGEKLWNLPFVYVFGKSDQTAILYGANIYPENIKAALEDETVRENFSGRLVMFTDLDNKKDQQLRIDIECAKGVVPTRHLTERVRDKIVDHLLHLNSEYSVVHKGIGERAIPVVSLFEYGDDKFQLKRIKYAPVLKKAA